MDWYNWLGIGWIAFCLYQHWKRGRDLEARFERNLRMTDEDRASLFG